MRTIRRCEPEYAELIAAVVMNDHAHVLVRPKAGITAKRLASAWKGATAHLFCAPGGRSSPLWQREYFDRWMESPQQLEASRAYILDNPRRRWPTLSHYQWVVDNPGRRSPPTI